MNWKCVLMIQIVELNFEGKNQDTNNFSTLSLYTIQNSTMELKQSSNEKKTNHLIEFIFLLDDICYKNNKKIKRIEQKKKWSFSNVVKSSEITDKFHETTKRIIRNQCQVHELRTHCNVIHFILINVRSINFDDYANVCNMQWKMNLIIIKIFLYLHRYEIRRIQKAHKTFTSN